MFVCAKCGSDQVQRLEPAWFWANDGRLADGGADLDTIDTYCDGCGENGIEIIDKHDEVPEVGQATSAPHDPAVG